tara:strand:+ start:3835 stop:4071 length:237 start_codon:yes stop_codon:yes gene_type:complete
LGCLVLRKKNNLPQQFRALLLVPIYHNLHRKEEKDAEENPVVEEKAAAEKAEKAEKAAAEKAEKAAEPKDVAKVVLFF